MQQALKHFAWRCASLNRTQDAIEANRRLIRGDARLQNDWPRGDFGLFTFDVSELCRLYLQSGESGRAYREIAKSLSVVESCDEPGIVMMYLKDLANVLVAANRKAIPRHKRLLKKLLSLLDIPAEEIERRCDSSFTQAVERTAKDMNAADRRFQGHWLWIRDRLLTRPRGRKAIVQRVREFLELEPIGWYRKQALQRFVEVILM